MRTCKHCVPYQAVVQFALSHDDAGLAVGQHVADALQVGEQVLAVVGFSPVGHGFLEETEKMMKEIHDLQWLAVSGK